MTLQEKRELYKRLLHAMQTGVAFTIEATPSISNTECSPKHLRVGVNSAMIDSAAVARLLMKKGIINEDEYYDMLIEVTREEVESYKKKLNEMYGANSNISLDGF